MNELPSQMSEFWTSQFIWAISEGPVEFYALTSYIKYCRTALELLEPEINFRRSRFDLHCSQINSNLVELYLETSNPQVNCDQMADYIQLEYPGRRFQYSEVRCLDQFISAGITFKSALQVLREHLPPSKLSYVLSQLHSHWFDQDLHLLVDDIIFQEIVEMLRVQERTKLLGCLLAVLDKRIEHFREISSISLGDITYDSASVDFDLNHIETISKAILVKNVLTVKEFNILRRVAEIWNAKSEIPPEIARTLLSELTDGKYFFDVVFGREK